MTFLKSVNEFVAKTVKKNTEKILKDCENDYDRKIAKAFKGVNIDLNGKDVSDVILSVGFFADKRYLNIMTGGLSHNIEDVIRDEKRYLVFKEPFNDIRGLYVKYLEEKDTLIFIRTILKEMPEGYRWVEENRGFISKQGTCTKGVLDNYYPNFGFFYDMCGQAYPSPSDKENFENYFVGAKEEAFEFFGGYARPLGFDMIDFSSVASFKMLFLLINNNVDFMVRSKKDVYSTTKEENINSDFLPFSKEAQMAILDYTKLILETAKEIIKKSYASYTGKAHDFCILQNTERGLVQRIFRTSIMLDKDIDKTRIKIFEYKNVYVDEILKEENNKKWSFLLFASDYDIIWRDTNLKGTCIENTAWLIDDAISDAKYAEKEYGINSKAFLYTAAAVGSCNITESIINIAKRNADYNTIKKLLGVIGTESPFGVFLLFRGFDYSQKELHKALEIPKGLLEELMRVNRIELLGWIKYIFTLNDGYENKGTREYFLSMNKEEVTELVSLIDDFFKKAEFFSEGRHLTLSRDAYFIMLNRMVMTYGVKSWKSYMLFVAEHFTDKERFEEYFDYIYSAKWVANNTDITTDWKLYGESIKQLTEEFNILKEIKESESFIDKDAQEKFNLLSDKWKKYEYENSRYLITYPKEPKDLIIEGVSLHHCAKQFIPALAEDRTTVLFIRQKSAPDKPYFTLEIRDGQIRQCHGKCNENIDDIRLKKFLKDFCKENNIEYNDGDKITGV